MSLSWFGAYNWYGPLKLFTKRYMSAYVAEEMLPPAAFTWLLSVADIGKPS